MGEVRIDGRGDHLGVDLAEFFDAVRKGDNLGRANERAETRSAVGASADITPLSINCGRDQNPVVTFSK